MVTCSLSKERLSLSQQEKVKKECSKTVGKFLALRDEYDYLPNILVTLSCKKNRLTDTIELRNKFIKLLNQIKKDYDLAYFTAIEFDSVNNDEYKTWYNWHCHIQLFTNIPIEKLQACLNKLPTDMCQFNDIQEANNKNARFDYVIKDCKKKTINWDLHSTMKLKFPKKSLYTMSRKELPDYIYKKVSAYLNSNFKEQWKEVRYKYKFIKELLKNRDILIENNMTDEDYESLKNINIIDTVIAKTKQLLIKKENIFKKQKEKKLDIDDGLIIKELSINDFKSTNSLIYNQNYDLSRLRLLMNDKKNMSERDICTKYITPALKKAGWDIQSQVREEVSFTDGRISVKGNKTSRGEKKRADYILYYKPNIPVAIIEAKKNTLSLNAGIQQGIEYSLILDIPVVFSSNGDGFYEHDRTLSSGNVEQELSLDNFPSPEELWKRYKKFKGIETEEQNKIVSQEYYFDGTGRSPRYYQQIAINRTVEAVAKRQNRILLVMATGTGKTYTAFQIIHRLWQSLTKKRILFLADRNALIDQTRRGDFRHFKDKMTVVIPHLHHKDSENNIILSFSL